MSTLQTVYLVILGICILASGFFSGSETALIGIPRERVRQLAGDRRGHHLADLVADYESTLSTLLVANNFVNILAAAVATSLFIDLAGEDWGPWLATLAITAVILVVGEITPKSLATRYPEQFSLVVAPTIHRLRLFLRPVSRIFQGAARLLFRLFRLPTDVIQPQVTEEDIRAMAALGHEEGEIESVEKEIIHSLFALADRPVREVMTPRPDIVTLDLGVTAAEVRLAVAATGHSRFPVASGDLDEIQGILYVKDVLGRSHEPGPEEIAALIRQPVYVPESKPILALLQEMRTRRWGIAVVTDEHGGVEGLVTVKDLVSELTGELHDEFDPGAPRIVPAGAHQWLVDGRVPIEELAETVGTALPQGEYSTAGGLFLDIAGHIPEVGDAVELDGLRMIVVRMDRQRIDRLRVQQDH